MASDCLYKRLNPAHISLSGWNPKFKQANFDGVEIEKTKDKIIGERVVANAKLKQGRTILEEDPFIRQLNDANRTTHCTYCFTEFKKIKKLCRNKDCKWEVLYCSLNCQQQHWLTEHKWFCRFPNLANTDKNVLFALQGYIASRSKSEYTLPGLVSNIDSYKPEDLEEYRKKIGNNELSKVFHLTEGVIESMVVIMAQIRCNTFAVKQFVISKTLEIEERETITLGRAIYLTASKFNHSCNPNALVLFGTNNVGSHLKVHFIGDEAKKNAEINISYGPVSTRHSKKQRKKKLKDEYFFDCNCSSCQLSYDPITSIYKCQRCRKGRLSDIKSQCDYCDFDQNYLIIPKIEREIKTLKDKAYMTKDLKIYKEALNYLLEIYHENTLPIGQWWDDVGAMYVKNGQLYEASTCVKKSIEIVQIVFGNVSIEVAEELCKLTGVLLESYQTAECFQTAMSAISIFKILGLDQSRPSDFQYLEDAVSFTRYSQTKSF
ncbi:hypothetical protein G6F44_007106 [Rhizopus delemar]|nr:hypothetical protein G6F44_007106 [Rhizopus delemar]